MPPACGGSLPPAHDARGEGVRRLDLILRRVDQKGASLQDRHRPGDPGRGIIWRACSTSGCETVDPGFGIEEMVLARQPGRASRRDADEAHGIAAGRGAGADMSRLVDRLGARLGPDTVYRVAPVESLIPERMTRRVAAARSAGRVRPGPTNLPRPTRLLDPPEPVVATALLPDHPPASFVWRKVRHRVAQGRRPRAHRARMVGGRRGRPVARDYYRVETEPGARFWLFRDAPTDEGGRWWLHGLFA